MLSQARSGQNSQYTEDELRAIVSTAKDYGFRVAAHAHGTEGIKRAALRRRFDRTRHADGRRGDRLVQENRRVVRADHGGKPLCGRQVQGSRILHAGRAPKSGSHRPADSGHLRAPTKWREDRVRHRRQAFSPHGENAKEFAYMVEAGLLRLIDAIRSATLSAASLLDQTGRLGAIEPGYAADIVAVSGDPLR
ncbi:amidohydrolase family protein [Massilia sp. B-10]|nr:amidohydrolase family protein [Massilia sp. B-10]